jgi:uncharacterized protein (DUF433 family)
MTAETQRISGTYVAEPVEGFPHLEHRPKSWRRQPYLKGRNLPVGKLIWKMRVAGHTPETAAEDYEIPVEQIREAVAYYERHRDVVDQDEADERAMLIAQGVIQAP